MPVLFARKEAARLTEFLTSEGLPDRPPFSGGIDRPRTPNERRFRAGIAGPDQDEPSSVLIPGGARDAGSSGSEGQNAKDQRKGPT